MGRVVYARDPVGETSALSCSHLAQGEVSERARVRREVFTSRGTAWRDDRTSPSITVARVLFGKELAASEANSRRVW